MTLLAFPGWVNVSPVVNLVCIVGSLLFSWSIALISFPPLSSPYPSRRNFKLTVRRVWHSQLTCVGFEFCYLAHVGWNRVCDFLLVEHWNSVCALSDGQCQLTLWISNQHSNCLERSQISTGLFRVEFEEGEEVKEILYWGSLPNPCLRWCTLNGDNEELLVREMLLSWWQKAKIA